MVLGLNFLTQWGAGMEQLYKSNVVQCKKNEVNFVRVCQTETEKQKQQVSLQVSIAPADKIFYQTSVVVLGKGEAIEIINELSKTLDINVKIED